MSACVMTTQIVMTLIASWSGRKKTMLYTLTNKPIALVAIQILDGVGAGIFGWCGGIQTPWCGDIQTPFASVDIFYSMAQTPTVPPTHQRAKD
jgi:hypothetical protein